jgi:hypothetical protein
MVSISIAYNDRMPGTQERFPVGHQGEDLTIHGYLEPKVFMRFNQPGEYNRSWAKVATNREFKKGSPTLLQLEADIAQNGIKVPVMVYLAPNGRGVVVNGHHRVLVCLSLGILIPVHYTGNPAYEAQAFKAQIAIGTIHF